MVEPKHRHGAHRPRPRPSPAAAPVPDAEPLEPAASQRPAVTDARRQHRRNVGGLVAAVVITAGVVVAAVLIVVDGRSGSSGTAASSTTADQSTATITDTTASNAFVAGATSDIPAVTTYDYRSLDTTLNNGLTVTTGGYQNAFRTALTGSLATEAKRVHRVQTFALLAAGIGTLAKNGASAQVLVFGAQSDTDDTTGGRPRQTLVTLTATIVRRANRYLISDLEAGRNAGLPAGTAGLRAAAEAGRSEVTAVLTLRHDHYDADYDTALAGAVDPLRKSLTGQSAATRRRITQGGYDLAGTVTAVAVQSAGGDSLVLLVAATGTRTTAGRTSVVVDGRYRVTVVRVSGRWVTSSINAVTPG